MLLSALEQAIRRTLGATSPTLAAGNAGAALDALPRGPLDARLHEAMVTSLASSAARVHKALEAGDRRGIGDQLHAVRGAFAMIGEPAIAAMCAQLSALAKHAEMAVLAPGWAELQAAAEAALVRRAAGAAAPHG
ncbi:hypothetical protein D9M72_580080 [compost metagenome]